MPHLRKLKEAEILTRNYGEILLLATWRDGLNNLSVVYMLIEPKQETRLHVHPFEEIAYLIKGKVKAQVGDENFELKATSCIAIFAHEPHKFINESSETCEILLSLSPHRDPAKVVYVE